MLGLLLCTALAVPAMEKSGDALLERTWQGSRDMPREMPFRDKVAGTERAGEAREAERRGH